MEISCVLSCWINDTHTAKFAGVLAGFGVDGLGAEFILFFKLNRVCVLARCGLKARHAFTMQRDLVILSSSPVPSLEELRNLRALSTIHVGSSPPGVPLPGSVLGPSRPSALRTGSHAKTIPERAILGFQNALSLPLGQLDPPEPVVEPKKAKATRAKSTATRAKKVTKKAAASIEKLAVSIENAVVQDDSEFKDIDAVEPPAKKRGRPKKADNGAPKKARKSRAPKAPKVTKATKEVSPFFEGKENQVQKKSTVDLTREELDGRRRAWSPSGSNTPLGASAPALTNSTSNLSAFAYIPPVPRLSPEKSESILSKRKRLDVVESAQLPAPPKEVVFPPITNVSPKKSPTKKLKTITALALDRFDPLRDDEEMVVPNPVPEPEPMAPPKKTKGKGKAAVSKVTKKPPEPKLLSPLSAVQRLERQSLQFGTSSQLAGAESPTYLRNLQKALAESAASGPIANETLKKFRTAKRTSLGSMWGAGALYSDESVLEMSKATEFKDIDDFKSSPRQEPVQTKADDVALPDIDQPLLKGAVEDGTLQSAPTNLPTPQRPRGRPRKESSASTVAATVKSTNKTAKIRTPKRAVGRPRTLKKAAMDLAEFPNIDDIQDSEPELTPSPPRLIKSATAPLELTSKSPVKASRAAKTGMRADWDIIKVTLFLKITDVVMNAPRSTDPDNMSWYEKMLTYEPIVLEDLTAWLNDQGLGIELAEKEQKDPILPWMAQKWCEEQSICCLWKLTNRKTERRKV